MNFDKMIAEKEQAFLMISETIKEKTEQYESEMNELESERLRLQGEYRILSQLKTESESEPIEEIAAEIVE